MNDPVKERDRVTSLFIKYVPISLANAAKVSTLSKLLRHSECERLPSSAASSNFSSRSRTLEMRMKSLG